MFRQLLIVLVQLLANRRAAVTPSPDRCPECGVLDVPELSAVTVAGLEHIARRAGYFTAADMLRGLGRELELIEALHTLEACETELVAHGCTLAARSVRRALVDLRAELEPDDDDDDDDDDE